MVSRFDEVLHLMDPEKEPAVAGLRAGPCGRGPVEDDASVVSMQVWLYQQRSDGRVAVATGRSGEDAASKGERPPYKGVPVQQGKWMIRTGLDDNSDEFSPDEPVSALAIAIVNTPEGDTVVEQWDQTIRLHADDQPHH